MTKRRYRGLFLAVLALLVVASAAQAADSVLSRWRQRQEFKDEENRLEVEATYYASEYIEALVRAEAEKNLW
ncbi:MAG TPA: hypothetical protein DIC53_02070, partial [Synergistaceae bacterium]|nr:hypothetical protein [Synergistaceae bacterium]